MIQNSVIGLASGIIGGAFYELIRQKAWNELAEALLPRLVRAGVTGGVAGVVVSLGVSAVQCAFFNNYLSLDGATGVSLSPLSGYRYFLRARMSCAISRRPRSVLRTIVSEYRSRRSLPTRTYSFSLSTRIVLEISVMLRLVNSPIDA